MRKRKKFGWITLLIVAAGAAIIGAWKHSTINKKVDEVKDKAKMK